MTPARTRRVHLAMPLLAKELIELAARRRTYILRVVYAIVLFATALIMLAELGQRHNYDVLRMIGQGHELFFVLVMVQLGAVYVVVPATIAPAITYEKERNALELLLLTGISPWQILIQKFVGRLMPMLTLMLLCLPAAAVAYAYGGFGQEQIIGSTYVLLLACLQVAAIGLMWSCFCRTTAEAFILTYVTLGLLFLAPGLASEMVGIPVMGDVEDYVFSFAPPYIMGETFDWGWGSSGSNLIGALGFGVWFTIIIPMLLARFWLVRRMNVTPRRYAMRLLRWLDGRFRNLNHLTGHIIVVRDRGDLPDSQPIAWRETRSRWIGRPNHLIRVLLLVEVPVFFLAVQPLANGTHYGDTLHGLLFFLWGASALLLIVQTVSVIGSERSRQTLDVLLTTPITGREILRQKLAPVRRLLAAVIVPLATIILIDLWWRTALAGGWYGDNPWLYLPISVACIAVYLPLCIWGATAITLRMRSHGRALIVAVMTAVAVCIIPPVLCLPLLLMDISGDAGAIQLLAGLSPVAIITMNEFGEIGRNFQTAIACFALFLTAAVVIVLRLLCYMDADRLLGRTVPPLPVEAPAEFDQTQGVPS